MQLDIMDAVHLRVCRLWAAFDVEPIWVEIDHSEMQLTYHGQDVAEFGENLRRLATDYKWVTNTGGGSVHETGGAVTVRLDEHMARANFDEGRTAGALQHQLADLVAIGQVTEDDDQRSDAVERLGQAVELLLDQVQHSSLNDVVVFSRKQLRADLARALGVDQAVGS